MSAGQFLVTLVIIFGGAKLFGELAERIGQPAVLGELFAGIVFGASFLHLVDPHDETVRLLSELGVVLLLFLIGLETDLAKLLSVGISSSLVAAVGVAVPFALGFAVARLLGYPMVLSIFVGAALTATSVGITARVLSDLGQLHAVESQVVLGAAVIDDVIGLVILAIVTALAKGEAVTFWLVSKTTIVAFGFVALAITIGSVLAPRLILMVEKLRVGKALLFASLMFAFLLAWTADQIGSALIVGAFAAGLVLARTNKAEQIAHEIHDLSQFFVPIFFVSVGAAIDLKSINPFDPATRPFFFIGLLLTVVAILGKVVAGFAAVGKGMRRLVIGVGMIPRGEVGLIFARIGLAAGLLSVGVYSSIVTMVMVTTFITPPLLRMMLPKAQPQEFGAVARVVTEGPFEDDYEIGSSEGRKTDAPEVPSDPQT